MKLIKTDKGDIINVDGDLRGYRGCWRCWGYRWNKNEGRFGTQCCEFNFNGYEDDVDESELTVTRPLDLE